MKLIVFQIIDYIDPNRNIIQTIIDKTHCIEVKPNFYIKDLRVLVNREIDNILIVDHLAYSFGF